jgi:hypothetical protein
MRAIEARPAAAWYLELKESGLLARSLAMRQPMAERLVLHEAAREHSD